MAAKYLRNPQHSRPYLQETQPLTSGRGCDSVEIYEIPSKFLTTFVGFVETFSKIRVFRRGHPSASSLAFHILEAHMKRYVALFSVLAIVAFGFIPAVAQSSRGAVTATVQDAAGAVLADADVMLLSPSTGVSSTITTNKAGIYRFEAVLAGDYVVSAVAPGFGKQQTTATVTVGALVGRDFTLAVSSLGTSVEVSTSSTELQTEDAVRGSTIPATALAELPILNQNSLNLILTAPGVVRSNQSGSLDSGIGAVNGARARSNNFLIDGLQNNDISVAGPQFSITNNDELQEVSFQTSNFTPEYGPAGGAVVNQITKSGTNAIHGAVATNYRTQILNTSTNTT